MKYIRKCINEAVKLPAKRDKHVSLDDIPQLTDAKHYVCDTVNKELISQCFPNNDMINYEYYIKLTKTLQSCCLHYVYNADNNSSTRGKHNKIDFSIGLSAKEDKNNAGKYIVYLCVVGYNIFGRGANGILLENVVNFNKLLNYICDKHSELISDIRLKNVSLVTNTFENDPTFYDNTGKDYVKEQIRYLPFPAGEELRHEYFKKDKIEFMSILQMEILQDMTDDQLKNLVELISRFDDVVANTGIGGELSLGSSIDRVDMLRKVMNYIYPKCNFKFNYIDIYLHIEGASSDKYKDISCLNMNVMSDMFSLRNVSKIAYDIDKFYVSSFEFYDVVCANVELYIHNCTDKRIKLMRQMFTDNLNRKSAFHKVLDYYYPNVCLVYYPKTNEICVAYANNNIFSQNVMFVSLDEMLDFIIDNASDPDAITDAEIKSELIKLFNLKFK